MASNASSKLSSEESGRRYDSRRDEPTAEDRGSADINGLAHDFSEVARSLQASQDTEEMLEELVASAVRLIPGTEEGSLSVVIGRRHVHSQHPTGGMPARVDAVQTETGEGPCLDAVYEQQTVRVTDMAHEQRWPHFARKAAELGAASMLSFQLYVEEDNLGALNLYSRSIGAFDDESEQVGLLFASHAAVAFAHAQRLDQLNRAVSSRDLIGQAKGILMERYQMSADHAFRALTRVSQTRNTKMRDIAEELTTTRLLPGLN